MKEYISNLFIGVLPFLVVVFFTMFVFHLFTAGENIWLSIGMFVLTPIILLGVRYIEKLDSESLK